jgi:hypothetical protein
VWRDLTANQDRMYFDTNGAVTFPFQHYSMYARAAAQAIPNATWTTLAIDTLDWANGITQAGSIFTTPAQGIYLMVASVGWEANGVGLRGIRIMRAGSAQAGCIHGADNTAGQTVSVAYAFYTAGGDTWSVQVYQTSGGALNTASDTTLNTMVDREFELLLARVDALRGDLTELTADVHRLSARIEVLHVRVAIISAVVGALAALLVSHPGLAILTALLGR